MLNENKLIEELSNYEHNRWSRWQKYLFNKCIINEDGSLTIPKKFVDRWTRQMNTNYINLDNEEQESDRKEARLILDIIKEYLK